MNLLNNLVFKQKLILLVLIPLLATLYFSLTNLHALTSKQGQLEDIQELITLTIANNALVHELQKERGATAVYLGSMGGNTIRINYVIRSVQDLVHIDFTRLASSRNAFQASLTRSTIFP